MTNKTIPQKLFITKLQNCLSCWQQKKPIIEKAFIRGAIAGAFSGILPNEIAAHIGLFIGRNEGGRLACTSKKAVRLAKVEEANAEELIKSIMPQLKSNVEKELMQAEAEEKAVIEQFLKPGPSFSFR